MSRSHRTRTLVLRTLLAVALLVPGLASAQDDIGGAGEERGSSPKAEKKVKQKKPPQTRARVTFVPVDSTGSYQSLGGVEISVDVLTNRLRDYPDLFAFSRMDLDMAAAMWAAQGGEPMSIPGVLKKDGNDRYWVNILGDPMCATGFAAFFVRVKNNTDHILNFAKDAKVYLKPQNAREPMPPAKTQQDYTAIQRALAEMDVAYENSRGKSALGGILGIKTNSYPVGISPALFAMRWGMSTNTNMDFINSDVLPGFEGGGILLFPSLIDASTTTVDLMMFEVPTGTDAAGQITQRSRFTFKFRPVVQKEWFHDQLKTWVAGEPPVEAAADAAQVSAEASKD